MSKQEKKGLVPELRFPEFRYSEEWRLESLGNKKVSKFVKERETLERLRLDTYVSTENLLPDYAGVTKASKLPPSGSFTRYEKGDILISNIRPYLKKVWSADKEGASSNDVVVVRSGEQITSGFLTSILKNDQFINYVMKGAKGVKMPRGDISSMKEYPVAYPKDAEQQKVADCLTSIDALVTAHSQKLESLKQHKKGLMQQLFPAEGETEPKRRFPEFRGTGEWNTKELGKSLVRHPEYGVNAPAVPFSEELPTYLRITDISEDGFLFHEDMMSVAVDITEDNYLQDGDIVLARTGASVGKSYKYRPEDGGLVFAGFLIRVRPNSKKLISGFLSQFLFTEQYWKWVSITSPRGGQPGINGNEYASLSIPMPPKLEEQQKIADCLSAIDERIAAQAKKVETLKAHKKGLMQQLFPAMDEGAI